MNGKIIPFPRRKPCNIEPYIDFDKGWKFTEADKEFIIVFLEDEIEAKNEFYDGDFVEEPMEILASVKQFGVEKSKDMIQNHAKFYAESVDNDIYQYYASAYDVLKFIEMSILALDFE